MTVGQKIKILRKKNGLTQKQLSEKLGLAPTAVSAWERDANNPMMDSLSKMSKLFDVPISYFYDLNDPNELKNKTNVTPYRNVVKETQYPYISNPISAGLPENVEGVTKEEKLSVPDSIMGKHARSQNILMMRINGESMNRIIPHGSLIAVKKTSLENLKNGDVVVYGDDHSYSVKRFYRSEDKLIFRPDSVDERFTDYVISNDKLVEIVGKVVVYVVELD